MIAVVRPIRAASLVILSAGKVLIGRRDGALANFPNAWAFPGGILDRADYRAQISAPLTPQTSADMRRYASARLSTALAVCALRETAEETGYRLGAGASGAYDLSQLHFFARAITPTTRHKRYDVAFFWTEAQAALELPPPNAEFSAWLWASETDMPNLETAPVTPLIWRLAQEASISVSSAPVRITTRRGRRHVTPFHRL